MADQQPDPRPEPDFRHLPPRITPEEMVPVQPLVHAVPRAAVGSEDEWQLRAGGAG